MGRGERCEDWIEKMRRAGVQPNSFTYNSAAKPYAARGNYRKVEKLVEDLRRDGLPWDDFCLTSLLYAYSNAKPRQRQRAEEVFQEFAAEGVRMTHTAIQALQRAIGRSEAFALCEQCAVDPRGVKGSGRGGDARVTFKKPTSPGSPGTNVMNFA